MPIRPLIAALLWLTYVLTLGHSLLPHHHHDEGGHTAHHHPVAAHHHHESDHDHESEEASDDADWLFGHQHTPGIESSQSTAPDTHQAPTAAEAVALQLPRFTVVIRWIGQTVGWPPTQAKAPPEPYRFRPLRAPPVSLLTA